MSRDVLLTALHDAVDKGDHDRARVVFERLQLQHPATAAEIIARLSLSDEQARAIGAA